MSLANADAPGNPGGCDAASLTALADPLPDASLTRKPLKLGYSPCPLRHANRNGIGGKDAAWSIMHRCRHLSCPDCGRFDARGRAASAKAVCMTWTLDRVGVTALFPPVPVADLTADYLEGCASWAERFAAALKADPRVAAAFVKMEVDQARRSKPGVPTAVVHVHALVMTESGSPESVVDACLPAGVTDVKYEPEPDAGWAGYLAKGVVPALVASNRNPKVLAAIGERVDAWQLATRRRRAFWYSGLFDRRVHRFARKGAGIAKALGDDSAWRGLYEATQRCRARAWARGLASYQKWKRYADRYQPVWRIKVPLAPGGKFKFWQIKAKGKSKPTT
jgi:hypothetical protein